MMNLIKYRHVPTGEIGIDFITEEQAQNYPLEMDVLDYRKYPEGTKLFKVIIAGGRDFNNFYLLMQELDFLLAEKEKDHAIVIVSGKAKGADSLGEDYAKLRGYLVDEYPADWDTHGKKAGFLRNVDMANNSEALVAFWDGRSKGTKHMIDIAHGKGLSYRIINY